MTHIADPVLTLRDVTAHYGRIQALQGVSLFLGAGEIVALIGANGAGKTTTLKVISGIMPSTGGEILHEGVGIEGLPPHDIVRRGIVQVPEGRRIFARLTVAENLQLGGFLRTPGARREEEEKAMAMFPRLRERYRQLGGTLSGGEQQMLAMARALMAGPRILLLDEPSMGLAPIVVDQIFEAILSVRALGVAVLLVEQNALRTLQIADRAYVLETGRIAMDGSAGSLAEDPRVVEMYLG